MRVGDVKAPARWLRRRSVQVDRVTTKVELAWLIRRREPIIVYSMGKAGTSAVTSALEAATERPILKVHAVTPAGIEERRATHGARPRALWAGEELRRAFRTTRSWQVITCVRDPIARAVSAYFYSGRTDPSVGAVATVVEQLSFRDWFDEELEASTGVAVYSHPFDPAVGYQRYCDAHFDLLLLRTEDLRRVGPSVLSDHLGLAAGSMIEIRERNAGTAGAGGSLYETFKRAGRLPRALVDEVYETRLAQHFYSADERAALADRWSSGASARLH